MDFLTVLSKCIMLLFREGQLEDSSDNSADIVMTAVEKIPVNDTDIGIMTARNAIAMMKNLVIEMCRQHHTHKYELQELLQQIRVSACGDDAIFKAVSTGLEAEMTQPVLRRTITNLKKTIKDFYRNRLAAEKLKKAHRDFNFYANNIEDKDAYLKNLIAELEVLTRKTSGKDPGLVKSMSFTGENESSEIFEEAESSAGRGLAYKTGFKELDDALQGGPRPGDTVMISALQHNYKTGFSLSVFTNMVAFNTPRNKDTTKKPLAYRVTVEDPLRNNVQFMYQLIKHQETGEEADLTKVGAKEARDYVSSYLRRTGYHVLMDEVNPMEWNYQAIISRLVELQSQGYVIEIFCIDYLSKVSKEGCTQGALGDDMLDLLTRLRAFTAANGIIFVTPHQLSTAAKGLLQNLPHYRFLETIKGGGYFEKAKGLDRIYDIGILLHKCETPTGDWLHVLIDKHRFPTVVESAKKSFFLQFPKNRMPIPSNYDLVGYKVHRKLPSNAMDADSSLFI